ncbi:hypothetical protein ACJMK2_035881 [Sinanodonta woodiana]|uniref:Uncharacterized protein n=1 Tax=Sinanodonta woodiana TaxID=1069815 RepID=A0ABD3WFG6_SINWO
MARHDAAREGDGDRIISHGRILNCSDFKRTKCEVRRNADIEGLVKIILDNKSSGRCHSA